jgi:hypothetical protein
VSRSDGPADAPSERVDPSLPWRRGGWGLLLVLVGSVLLVTAGFVAGGLLTSPEDEASRTDASATGWTPVTRRAVPAADPLNGRVRAGRATPVEAALPEGAKKLVVTEVDVRSGERVSPGDLLAVVSGRPLILVRNGFQFYRDLRPGDRGEDVLALQRILRSDGVLAGSPDGEFGASTQEAVSRFYDDRDVTARSGGADAAAAVREAEREVAQLSDDATAAERRTARETLAAARLAAGAWVPLGELVVISTPDATVDSVVGRGAVLEEGSAVMTLRQGDVTVVARADALAVESFAVGTRVSIRLAGTADSLPGVVSAVGPFVDGSGTADDFPGRDVTVSFDVPPDAPPGTTGTVRTAAEAGPEQTAVPLVALREDADGAYVLRKPPGAGGDAAGARGERVPVDVTAQADGWALVTGTGLTPGDLVRVGP